MSAREIAVIEVVSGVRTSRRTSRLLSTAVSVGCLALGAGFVIALPRFIGVGWSQIGETLASIPVTTLLALVALWAAGVLAHVPVLTRSLPGLTGPRALRLNLSGVAISSLLPFGGTAGMGVGFAMTRSWGFGSEEFASFALVSNLANVLGRLGFSMSLLAVAAALGAHLPAGAAMVTWSALAFVLMLVVAAIAVLRTSCAAHACDRLVERVWRRLRPRAAAPAVVLVSGCRARLLSSLGTGWVGMCLGMLSHLALQCALLAGCVYAVGAQPSVLAVCVVFALDRLISLVPVTPAAVGIAEISGIAGLHAFGVPVVEATSAVLLYRLMLVGFSIPLGGMLLATWFRRESGRPTKTS